MSENSKKEMINQMLDQDLETDTGAVSPDPNPPEFPKSHPPGLWVLFTTEMWERFCYYGMRAFLVLYIYSTASSELNPGFGWTQSEAYHFYGIFTGLVYLMPLFCGWIADYFIGQHRSMVLGGILIALGEFTLCGTEFVRQGGGIGVNMQDDPVALFTFFAGLGLIIVGTGFFKPCVSVMVGQLYGEGDPRRDGGFTIFYMGINLGAFLSPFVAGTIAEKIGWEWGFFAAGIGMIFGLCTYSLFRPKYLSHLGLPPKAQKNRELTPQQIEKAKKDDYERTRPLTKVDLDRVYVILAMSLFVIAFWLSFEQAGSSLNVFAKKSTNRNVVSYERFPGLVRKAFIQNEFGLDLAASVKAIETLQDDAVGLLDLDKEEEKEQKKIKRITPFGKIKNFFTKKDETEKKITVDKRLAELVKKVEQCAPLLSIPLNEAGSVVVLLKSPKEIGESEEGQGMSEGESGNEKTDNVLEKLKSQLATVISEEESLEEKGPGLEETGLLAAPPEPGSGENESTEKKSFILTFESGKLNDSSLMDLGEALAVAGTSLDADQRSKLIAFFNKYPEAVGKLNEDLLKTEKMYTPGVDIRTFPATWYQSVNALGIVIFAPIFAFMWVFLGARNMQPSTPVKFGIGLLLVSLSFIVMVPGAIEASHTSGLAAPYWLVLSYVLATWGELCLSPVGLSMVSKLAPVRFASLLMGFWFISSAIANTLGGVMAGLFGAESADGGSGISFFFGKSAGMADFFLLMAIIPAITGVIVLLSASKLKRMMHGMQ